MSASSPQEDPLKLGADLPTEPEAAPPPTPPAAGQTTGTQRLRVRCPFCHNPLQLGDGLKDEVLCPACGSSFRIQDTTQTTTTSEMRQLGKFQYARAETALYVNRIAFAQREIEKGEFDRAADVLEECRWDLRGWEWRHLRRAALRLHCLDTHEGCSAGLLVTSDRVRCSSPSGPVRMRA
jgi:hypothetical protein